MLHKKRGEKSCRIGEYLLTMVPSIGLELARAEQWGWVFMHNGVKFSRMCQCKYAWRAAETCQPQLHPETIGVQHSQGTDGLEHTIDPKAARVKNLAVCFKKQNFHLFTTNAQTFLSPNYTWPSSSCVPLSISMWSLSSLIPKTNIQRGRYTDKAFKLVVPFFLHLEFTFWIQKKLICPYEISFIVRNFYNRWVQFKLYSVPLFI